MSDVTQILSQIESGDPHAAELLLPVVYEELRKLAAHKLAGEKAGQTLQPTALVHEAYLRLLGPACSAGPDLQMDVNGSQRSEVRGQRPEEKGGLVSDPRPPIPDSRHPTPAPPAPAWDSRGHFFAAAAEAMRRILVENARRKKRLKHGGGRQRVELGEHDIAEESPPEEILALDGALTQLAEEDPIAAKVVHLHYFAGVSIEEAAEMLGISRATAYRQWNYARAWLRCAIGECGEPPAAP